MPGPARPPHGWVLRRKGYGTGGRRYGEEHGDGQPCDEVRARSGHRPPGNKAGCRTTAAFEGTRQPDLGQQNDPAEMGRMEVWSGRRDLNPRPRRPERCALQAAPRPVAPSVAAGPVPRPAGSIEGSACPAERFGRPVEDRRDLSTVDRHAPEGLRRDRMGRRAAGRRPGRAEHDVTLFATGRLADQGASRVRLRAGPGLECGSATSSWTRPTLFSLVDAAERFDVLHVHSPFSALAAAVGSGCRPSTPCTGPSCRR